MSIVMKSWGLWSRATFCAEDLFLRLHKQALKYTCIHFCPLTDLFYCIVYDCRTALPGAVHFNHSNCILEHQLLLFITNFRHAMLLLLYIPLFFLVFCLINFVMLRECMFLLCGLEALAAWIVDYKFENQPSIYVQFSSDGNKLNISFGERETLTVVLTCRTAV